MKVSPLAYFRPHLPNPQGALQSAWAINPLLTFTGTAMLLAVVVTLVGLVIDPRVITGAPAWLKPAKFAISISVYSFTLLWLLTFVRGHERAVRLISWITAVALGVEMVLIAGAAAAGTTSHFNMSTPLHGVVWVIMGVAIVLTWVMSLLLAVLLLRQRLPDPAFAWSLRLAVLVSSLGMAVAFLMTTPTPEQMATARAGRGMPVVGAHSVGVQDGGAGMPVTGWSTEGGDLRVPHFFGLHGLQVLPLVGWLVSRFGPAWLRPRHRVALVWVAGLSYLGFVLLLAWQALRGQPVAAPDVLTLWALLALAGAAVGAGLGVVLVAWQDGIARDRESGLLHSQE